MQVFLSKRIVKQYRLNHKLECIELYYIVQCTLVYDWNYIHVSLHGHLGFKLHVTGLIY